jgi:A/G-specific adenine glycosylase
VKVDRLADVAGWPDDPGRAWRVAESLVVEGLVTRNDAELCL